MGNNVCDEDPSLYIFRSLYHVKGLLVFASNPIKNQYMHQMFTKCIWSIKINILNRLVLQYSLHK